MLALNVLTVLGLDGLRGAIYPHDHRSAHVHVFPVDGEAVFILNCPDGMPELRESKGFDRRHLGRVRNALAPHVAELCDRWRMIHGDH